MKKKQKWTVFSVLGLLILLLFAAICIAPFIYMTIMSFTQSTTLMLHWSDINFGDFTNFNYVLKKTGFIRALTNSVIVVFCSCLFNCIIASMAAYGFAKKKFPGSKAIFRIYLLTLMIPGQVTIIPRFMLFKSMGLYNTLWSCILPFWFSTTAIFMLRQFYIGLPNDLMEAAKIDGAGHFRIFLQVLMPLTKPAMITLVILAFIGSWNEYLSPLIFITKQEKYTVAQAIRWYLLDELQRYDLTMAAATIAIVPVIILFISCQKYFVEGIATSGVKG